MRSRTRLLVLTVTALVSLAGSGSTAQAAPPPNMAIAWNQNFLQAVSSAKTPAPLANRMGAIVQSAVFDAVNGIEKRYTSIHVPAAGPDDASPQAAAAAAAHDVLVSLFPLQTATFDAELQAAVLSLGDDEDGSAVAAGVAWGQFVAGQIKDWRSHDHFSDPLPPYVPSGLPGRWAPTPGPFFPGPPLFRALANTTPFALTSAAQFAPPGPPALGSARSLQDLAEVMSIGAANSTTRTPYQTQTAVFWGVGVTPVGQWDRVADDLAMQNHFNLMKSARLLAQVNISIADAVISVFYAKSLFDSWRPITVLNPTFNPAGFLPLLVNPYFQEYPSAHSGTSSAATATMASVFGEQTTFTVMSNGLPGVTRTFTSFSDAAAQVGDARVFAGIHFRSACDDAITMGTQIADYVMNHMMLPARD